MDFKAGIVYHMIKTLLFFIFGLFNINRQFPAVLESSVSGSCLFVPLHKGQFLNHVLKSNILIN
jgi:hypothetical protein